MGSRSSPAYWTDSQNNVYVFGGYGYASDVNYAALSDVWKFDGNYWTFVTGSNTSYNWGNYGTKGVTSSSNLIPARRSHSFGTDSKGNLWVFGGSLTTFFNDLWKFDGKNWTWISGNNSYYNRGVGNYGTQGVSSSFNYPGGRWYSSLQIDSQDNIWMFGGSYDATQTYFFNDLWKFNGVNWTWISGSNSTNQSGVYGVIRVGSASNRIGARQPAITWIDTSNNLWVFGGYGYDSNGTVGYLNDLWKFDGSGVWTWISGSNVAGSSGNYGTKGVASSAAVPPCRVRSSGFSNGNEFFLFGGDSASFAYNDIWKFDGSNWTWIAGHNKSNQVGVYSANGYPGARSGSAFVKDSNNNFYVFGGFGAAATTQWGFLNDVWKFNGSQWTWLSGADTTNTIGFYEKIAGPIGPGAREEQTCAMDSLDNLWMFGGFIYNGGYYSHLNDLWKYNGTKWIWVSGSKTVDSQGSYGIKGVSSASNAPSARYSHAMAIRNDTIWMYGGINQYGVHNDLWRYDRGNWTWMYGSNLGGLGVVYGTKGVPSSNNTPGGRYSCAMEIDSQNRIWLFGGDAGGYRNDLWKFDGQWTWIGGPNSTNAAGVYGTMGVAVSTNIPGARRSHDSWIDSNNVLWIFGGEGYDSRGTVGQLNDLWSYNGVNWTWVSGSNYSNSYATYGVKGVASSSNVPGGRSSHNMWGDRFNQIWIFGGYGYSSSGAGSLNDLWKFDGFTWTWVSGSKSLNTYGNYTMGGNPGSRSGSCGDINSSNFIWLFGGNGLSATASGGQLNDLWNYGAVYDA